jgi:hypothetical protein
MIRRALIAALFLTLLVVPSAQATPVQWGVYVNTTTWVGFHWAVTTEPFQVNPGYNDGGVSAGCIDRALAAWDGSTALQGSNRVPLGSSEQEYPIVIAPNTGQDWAGIAYANFNAHGAIIPNAGTSTAPGETRIEFRADYATNQNVCSHEIGHLLGFDHANPLYDPDDIMGYDWGPQYPNAEELAFHDAVIQDHFDYPPTLRGPQNDTSASGVDSDADGIDDSFDVCPTQGTGTGVDSFGCQWTNPPVFDPEQPPPPAPVDTDGDGVPDDIDQCDTQVGPASNNGCPVVQPPKPCKRHKFKPCPSTGVTRQGNKFTYREYGSLVVVFADPERGRDLVRINPKTGLPAGVRR